MATLREKQENTLAKTDGLHFLPADKTRDVLQAVRNDPFVIHFWTRGPTSDHPNRKMEAKQKTATLDVQAHYKGPIDHERFKKDGLVFAWDLEGKKPFSIPVESVQSIQYAGRRVVAEEGGAADYAVL